MAARKPRIALPIFPGSNGEVDNLRTLRRCGFDAFLFRWNEDRSALDDCDGYFFGAGFSYEDRGRSGMVAARDPLFQFLTQEAEKGKVIIGNCNGAQMLIESGLIPLGDGVRMALAHNAVKHESEWEMTGFLNEWVWITPLCDQDRCATSHWTGTMHIPIAHGEGRFVTKDRDLIETLKQGNQLAFAYCSESGEVSENPPITPNGSLLGIAGICNPTGNVVALMPHPERTPLGDAYFLSIHEWLKRGVRPAQKRKESVGTVQRNIPLLSSNGPEVFIETIITNNEEKTVEKALASSAPSVRLKQYRYFSLMTDTPQRLLGTLSYFNPNKERAYMRKAHAFYRWHPERSEFSRCDQPILCGISFVRFDEPEPQGVSLGTTNRTGVCYDCRNIGETDAQSSSFLEVLSNPHSSTLTRIE